MPILERKELLVLTFASILQNLLTNEENYIKCVSVYDANISSDSS